MAARDGYLAVGTYGDAVGSVKSTGSVQIFTLSKGKVTPKTRLSQASTGVPGKAEKYDQFGRAVALATSCSGVPAVVVGAPAEAPEQLASQYLAGTLVSGANVCDH